MADQQEGPGNQPGYVPNFELSHHGVIREGNWAEFQAKGLVPLPEDLDAAQAYYGVENVFTGDAYDWAAERPLQHKPGVGVYVTQEGLRHLEESYGSGQKGIASVKQATIPPQAEEKPPRSKRPAANRGRPSGTRRSGPQQMRPPCRFDLFPLNERLC